MKSSLGKSLPVVVALLQLAGPLAVANEGDPLALRRWPGGSITIETQWGHCLRIDGGASPAKTPSRVPDHTVVGNENVDHGLSRLANESQTKWLPRTEIVPADPNAVWVRSLSEGGSNVCTLVEVDGVRMAFMSPTTGGTLGDLAKKELQGVDVVVAVLDGSESKSENRTEVLSRWASELHPRWIVFPASGDGPNNHVGDLVNTAKRSSLREIDHNTIAISRREGDADAVEFVTWTDQPWSMPDELEEAFAAMEKACRESQDVFRKLSVEQLNFRPANGTHTPRWNAEHMLGRQLLFFSQIYHAKNEAIPVIDLNPQQMPPDYKFAHPDWDGKEEARQMQRVSDFTRRFAYLLDGVALDQQAPGSRWPTLQALLVQMERHYHEHTANTVKKFELPGWPK